MLYWRATWITGMLFGISMAKNRLYLAFGIFDLYFLWDENGTDFKEN